MEIRLVEAAGGAGIAPSRPPAPSYAPPPAPAWTPPVPQPASPPPPAPAWTPPVPQPASPSLPLARPVPMPPTDWTAQARQRLLDEASERQVRSRVEMIDPHRGAERSETERRQREELLRRRMEDYAPPKKKEESDPYPLRPVEKPTWDDRFRQARNAASEHGAGLGAGSPGGMANAAKGAAAAGVGAVAGGPAGIAVDAILTGLMRFQEGLSQTADRLAQVNPQVAFAKSLAETNQLLGDIRRAQLNQNEIAANTLAASRLSQAAQDVWAVVTKPVVDGLTVVMEGNAFWLERLAALLGVKKGDEGDALEQFHRDMSNSIRTFTMPRRWDAARYGTNAAPPDNLPRNPLG